MKKLLLLLLAFTAAYSVNAQIETPQPSPSAEIEQMVGLTEVEVEYSRPNMRGRTIFGDLVPYDKVWRTGANARTKITFSTDFMIGDETLKAGTYAIFSKPGTETWDVFLYTDYEGGGAPQIWEDDKVAAKATLQAYKMPMKIETFTITFDDVSYDGATLGMFWEDVYVGLEFKVPTDKIVSESINKVMNGPGVGDYYSAAVYYSESGKDINQAKEWMEKAMSMVKEPRFWQLRQQSLIYAKAGDKKAAIAAAKKSLAGAKEAGNDDYVKMNTESLEEWGAM